PRLQQIRNNASLLPLLRYSDVYRAQFEVTFRRFKSVQAFIRAAPDDAAVIFKQYGNRPGGTVLLVRHDDCKHRPGARVILVRVDDAALRRRLRIEADEAGVGGHPVLATARFQKVIYLTVGQSLIRAVVRECITVKARQSVARAKPEESARVTD